MVEQVSYFPVAKRRLFSILIVEDSVTLRFTLAEWLRLSGYIVLEAASADEATVFLNSILDIDLVITDVEMPGTMNGYDLALYIKKEHATLPLIVVSGTASRKQFQDIGVPDFFAKPYNFTQLTNRVTQILPLQKGLADDE